MKRLMTLLACVGALIAPSAAAAQSATNTDTWIAAETGSSDRVIATGTVNAVTIVDPNPPPGAPNGNAVRGTETGSVTRTSAAGVNLGAASGVQTSCWDTGAVPGPHVYERLIGSSIFFERPPYDPVLHDTQSGQSCRAEQRVTRPANAAEYADIGVHVFDLRGETMASTPRFRCPAGGTYLDNSPCAGQAWRNDTDWEYFGGDFTAHSTDHGRVLIVDFHRVDLTVRSG